MKKVLFLIVTLVCAVTGAWANAVLSDDDKTLTITTSASGEVSNMVSSLQNKGGITKIVLVGKFSSNDLDAIKRDNGFNGVKIIDMSQAEFPKQAGGNTSYNVYATLPETSNNIHNNIVVGGTVYKSEGNWPTFEWVYQTSYTDGTTASNHYEAISDASAPDNKDVIIVVGGALYKPVHDYNNNSHTWDPFTDDGNDWTQMKFNYWNGLEEIVIPANIKADQLDQNNFYGDNNKRTLLKVTSGNTYAVVTHDDDNRTAQVFAGSDAEYDRMKAIVCWANFINQDKVTRASLSGDYIRYDANTKIAEVRVTEAGSFSKLFKGESNYETGTVFRFIDECENISAADLKLLATSEGKFYVDLYDVDKNTGIEDAIAKLKGENESDETFNARPDGVIDLMRVDNTQFRGLLLPQDPNKVGTTLIQDRAEDKGETEGQDGRKATCAEFIAYNNGSVTTMHIYKESSNGDSYKQRLETLKTKLLDAHVNDQNEKVIEKATTTYVVSTNYAVEIEDISLIKGSATATIVHTYNNEMVKDATDINPSMIVYPANAGAFATANSLTNIKNTPKLEKLKFTGSISSTDISALNDFKKRDENGNIIEGQYNGPKVLDLSEIPAAQITQTILAQLTNTAIEYIILPAGLTEPVVGDYSALTNLKAVISSNKQGDAEHNLTAYVKVAGSLLEARRLATGDVGSPVMNFTHVTLAGNLNLQDIKTGDGGALKGEQDNITSLDISDAVFANNSDMNLGSSGAGLINLTEVKLPTDDEMTVIPEKCLYGCSKLTSLHIPFNYTTIGWEAFRETGIGHITTEDANRALIDNGPNTYTLSANIAQLGKLGAGAQEGSAVFPSQKGVTDVYCMASRVPICYPYTFPADVVYGNGGMGDGPYCREKYIKGEKEIIALLHFPSEESFNKATGNTSGDKENNYNTLKQKYTDPTRNYNKIDQTGAVDANGNALVWPDQKELLVARNQAEKGYIWEDCTYRYAPDGHLEDPDYPTGEISNDFFPNYAGWHEFVLSQATYVKPDEHVVDDVVYNYYVDAGWYTICIPFDLSYNDVVKMLGVPKSTSKERSFIVKNGQVQNEVTEKDLMPDIRQLRTVQRTKGEGSQNNTIIFRLTPDLADQTNKTAKYLDFKESGDKWEYTMLSAKKEGETDDPTCMVGGRPYIIKVYKRTYRKGEGETATFDDEIIPSQNIGLYILKHYADDFKESASCLNNDGYYEQLKKYTYKELNGDQYEVDEIADGGTTMKFAKPYENHKVQAVNGAEGAGELSFTEDGKTKRYYYTMVGQFWEQDLPQYCIYMSKETWYRYTNPSLNFKWAPYKVVIMATPEVDEETIENFKPADMPAAEPILDELWTSTTVAKPMLPQIPKTELHPVGGFRDFKNCFFPMNMPGTNDLISGPLKLAFFGRDDYDFNKPGHHEIAKHNNTRYVFMLDGDEEVVELDENGNSVTAIATLDGETQGTAGTSKVYNLSGQYVGNSTEGLSKGIYIVDGRKIVVD